MSGNNSVVECNLAKVDVASSNLVSRSIKSTVVSTSGAAVFRGLKCILSIDHRLGGGRLSSLDKVLKMVVSLVLHAGLDAAVCIADELNGTIYRSS